MELTSPAKSTVRFTDSWASIHFDLLRGVAALLVLLEHWRNIFFLDYPNLTAHRWLFAIPYLLSGAGHQSVICFFVLSGYFIGGTVMRSMERNQWEWGGYLLRRLVRLWIVLLPTLLLCLLWDRLGMSLGHGPALYAGKVNNHMIGDVRSFISAGSFFGNLFFVQTILTPVFGSDGALWSLAYEFWYYILFPLGALVLWRKTPVVARILCGVLFLAAAWFVRGVILQYFPVWLAGVALFKASPPTFSAILGKRLRIASTFVYFGIFFGLGRLQSTSPLLRDYVLMAATVGYLWILLSHREAFSPVLPSVRGSREIARFSYTLYAAHTPILVLLASLAEGDTRWVPTPLHVAYGLGVLALVIGYAWGLATLTEFRTDSLRMAVEKAIGLKSARPVLPSNPFAAGGPQA